VERRYWYDWVREQSLALDKSISTLSSGAIGVTVIFITDFVSVAKEEVFISLGVSWLLFVSSIFFVHESQAASQEAAKTIIVEIDLQFQNKEHDKEIQKRIAISRKITWLNRLARWCFISAIIATFIFVILGIRAKEICK